MLVTGNVGAPQASSPSGSQSQPIRQGNMNDVIVSELHGTYYEGTYRGARFGGSMQAVLATATIAGVNTSITGTSVLFNPNGSSVNLVLEKIGLAFLLTPAAPLAFGIATGQSTTAIIGTLTSVIPKSKKLGSGIQPVGQLVASNTITLPVTPSVDVILGALDTGATNSTTSMSGLYDLQGSIIIPPGGYAVFYTSQVLAASAHIASWQWEEVPL